MECCPTQELDEAGRLELQSGMASMNYSLPWFTLSPARTRTGTPRMHVVSQEFLPYLRSAEWDEHWDWDGLMDEPKAVLIVIDSIHK